SPSASGTTAGPTTTASSGATVAPSALVVVSRASPTASSKSAATHNPPPTPNPGFWSQIATTSLPLGGAHTQLSISGVPAGVSCHADARIIEPPSLGVKP